MNYSQKLAKKEIGMYEVEVHMIEQGKPACYTYMLTCPYEMVREQAKMLAQKYSDGRIKKVIVRGSPDGRDKA